MNDIVIITCYSRPDYLRLCLDYLSLANGVRDKEIWVSIDRGKSLLREFYDVLNDFRDRLNIFTIVRPEHNYHGNTYNTLEAYKEAYATDAEFVYLIEEDVLVTSDFFKWHEAVQKTGQYLCSVAYRCSRNPQVRKDITDPTAYLVSSRDFASIGVAWRRTRLAPIIEHARPEYYGNLAGYLAKQFPNSFADGYFEQDGLVQRILGETHDSIVWSYTPRAFHYGCRGYNRPNGPNLSYSQIKEMIYDSEKIKEADKDFGDIEPMPRDNPAEWDATRLHCVQRFD